MTAETRELIDRLLPGAQSDAALDIVILTGIAIAAVVTYFVVKGLLYLFDAVVNRTPTEWDDDLLNHRFLRAVAQLAPALLINYLLPDFFDDDTSLHHWTRVATSFYIVWAVVHIISITLSNLYTALARRPALSTFAIKGVFQMARLVAIGLGTIVALSLLIGKTPLAIITAIGASAAVLMLVFRDTILGLVASVQLTANKMLHRGDWIVAPKYDVNGEVTDVSLTTVKVRNWDNSISTIPPYSLISDSFRNYEAMRLAGARRVERAVYIDIDSIRFLSASALECLREGGFLDGVEIGSDDRMVNLGLFRRYMERHLAESSLVRADLLYMVRQLDPTPTGVPLQIYFFTSVTDWKEFEHVQSDMMNHVYATLPLFGLAMFQSPAGKDFFSGSSNHTDISGV